MGHLLRDGSDDVVDQAVNLASGQQMLDVLVKLKTVGSFEGTDDALYQRYRSRVKDIMQLLNNRDYLLQERMRSALDRQERRNKRRVSSVGQRPMSLVEPQPGDIVPQRKRSSSVDHNAAGIRPSTSGGEKRAPQMYPQIDRGAEPDAGRKPAKGQITSDEPSSWLSSLALEVAAKAPIMNVQQPVYSPSAERGRRSITQPSQAVDTLAEELPARSRIGSVATVPRNQHRRLSAAPVVEEPPPYAENDRWDADAAIQPQYTATSGTNRSRASPIPVAIQKDTAGGSEMLDAAIQPQYSVTSGTNRSRTSPIPVAIQIDTSAASGMLDAATPLSRTSTGQRDCAAADDLSNDHLLLSQ